MWPFRRRTPDRLAVPATSTGREREAVEMLQQSEHKAVLMDALSHKADLLARELRRALGGTK